ncbi:MAG: glycoside hydrolase family 19 protein [Lutibacter sp.]|jgi:putative chitinase
MIELLSKIIERKITESELTQISEALILTFKKYDISTKLRQSHFIGQTIHESGQYFYKRENLNYSAKGLYNVFRKYFPTLEEAKKYERKPEVIANIVYANRMGNNFDGDGWKFRGAGAIQITGRDNFTLLSKDLQQDFISNPDLVAEYPYYILSAGWFWNLRRLNHYADNNDYRLITKRINGGFHGLEDRVKWTEKTKLIL